jgi:hypothetical protein
MTTSLSNFFFLKRLLRQEAAVPGKFEDLQHSLPFSFIRCR